jgi:Nif-specific regulatory protein
VPHLVLTEPGSVPVQVPLADELVIGRHDDCDLRLLDSAVSRRHARVERAEGGYRVIDLGSRHGTRVNGASVTTARLADGDTIHVGHALLVYRDEQHGAEPLVRHTATIDLAVHARGRDEKRLLAFYDVARALDALRDPDALIGRLLDTAVAVLDADAGVAGLVSAAGDRPRQLGRAGGAGELVVDPRLVQRMLDGREGLVVDEPRGESGLGAPMTTGGRISGFLYLSRARPFAAEDLEFLISFARLTGAAHVASRDVASAAVAAELAAEDGSLELVGDSAPMVAVKSAIARYGPADAAVLVRGESGTGKELVARALHERSTRAGQPFVAVNCAALPEQLVESELFGHARGAFTGATRDRRGRFALAHRGTIFLDEIGDLSLAAQAKVLRATQQGEIQPVGSEETVRVDVRIVSATHRDLAEEIARGRFREDLYYRLAVIEIELPPLRERGADIAVLATTLLRAAGRRVGKRLQGFSDDALAVLAAYRWPGNVRQLANEVERLAILAEAPVIDVELLGPRVRKGEPVPSSGTLAEQFAALEPSERALVAEALRRAGGNLTEAARLLGITRVMLKRRADRFGLI